MNAFITVSVAVASAYLIGAVPFGFLTAKWLRGVDIRTVGSGNIGATNVGRVFGFRFFLLVFAFDMGKGLLPTWGFPLLASRLTGRPAPPDLQVLVALATILGHNFPVYLRFKGGKGVATSLGAVLALDPWAGLASACGFLGSLAVTRYVSLSSIVGGLVFCLVHFARVTQPWSRGERAMSVLTVGLAVLLVARHRKNFVRIKDGTEPRVGRKKAGPSDGDRAGRIRPAWLVLLAAVAAVFPAGLKGWHRFEAGKTLNVGRYTLSEVARIRPGHQRAERVAFADGGRVVAVTYPRYDRLVLYRVTEGDGLEMIRDLELEGKPVAVCPAGDRLYVLQRPAGDSRHVKPGWWDSFDFRGMPIGSRNFVGYYPDDMALSADGRLGYVLTSGYAEGGAEKPAPALDVYETGTSKPLGRLTFDGERDDPARLTLSASGRGAVVVLRGSDTVASVDLNDRERPVLIGRSPLLGVQRPYLSFSEDDRVVMPSAMEAEGLSLGTPGLGDCVVSTVSDGSGLELARWSSRGAVVMGRLTLHAGAFGMSKTRPVGLAFCPERNLLAVANRSGSLHLVAIRTREEGGPMRTARK